MAHRIFGDRFLSRSEPAWHNLGLVFPQDEEILAEEAVKRVAGDVNVVSRPALWEDEAGVPQPVEGQRAIIRLGTKDSKEAFLGWATKSWHPTSYVELASALNDLSKVYKVETAGVLFEGGLCFLTLRGVEWEVKAAGVKDSMRTYFAANLSLTPGEAHKILYTPVREVCANTAIMAESAATVNVAIQHSMDAKQRIGLTASLIARLKEVERKTQELFSVLAATKVDTKQLEQIIEAAFPHPTLPPEIRLLKSTLNQTEQEIFKKGLDPLQVQRLIKSQEAYDRRVEVTMELRGLAKESYDRFNPAGLRGTAWSAWNAITEVADWTEGNKNVGQAVIWGERAKEKSRAFSKTLEVCGLSLS